MRTGMENVRPLGLPRADRPGVPKRGSTRASQPRGETKRKLILAGLMALLTCGVAPTLAQAYLPAPTLTAKGTTLEWTPAAGEEEATTDWELCTDDFFHCSNTGPQLEQKCEPTCKATLPAVGQTHHYDILAEKPAVSFLAYGYGGTWPAITYPAMSVGLNANKVENMESRRKELSEV